MASKSPKAGHEVHRKRSWFSSAKDDEEVHKPLEPHKKSFTDCTCLCVFLAYIGGLVYLFHFAQEHGNIKKVTHGFNWKGNICGVNNTGEDLVFKPYLYWCVQPDTSGLENANALQNGQIPAGIPSTPTFRLMDGICVEKCPGNNTTQHQCPDVPSYTQTAVTGPDGVITMDFTMQRQLKWENDIATQPLGAYCMPSENMEVMHSIMNKSASVGMVQQVYTGMQGVVQNQVFLITAAVLAFLAGYLYLALIWLIIKPLIITTLILIEILLFVFSAVFLLQGLPHYLPHIGDPLTTVLGEAKHQRFVGILWVFIQTPKAYVTVGGVAALVWFLYSIFLCCSCGAITRVVSAMKRTCETIMGMPTLLIQPVIQVFMLLVVITLMLYHLMWVMSLADIVTSDPMAAMASGAGHSSTVTGLKRDFYFTSEQQYMVAYSIFGLFWIKEVVNAMGQYTISHAVVDHMIARQEKKKAFTCKDKCCPLLKGYCNGFFLHLGSLAFGAFFIGILDVVSGAFKFFGAQAKAAGGDKVNPTAAILGCCACCVDRIIDFMRLVNQMVYVDIYLQGTGYVKSSYHVVKCMARNNAAIAILVTAATVVKYMGMLTIGGGGTYCVWWALSNPDHMLDIVESSTGGLRLSHNLTDAITAQASASVDSPNVIASTVVGGIICFSIAFLFMTIVESTANAMTYYELWAAEQRGDSIDEEDDEDGGRRCCCCKKRKKKEDAGGDKDFRLLEA